jgi:predicted RNase H-like nuclease (RuvC/YqgF family)
MFELIAKDYHVNVMIKQKQKILWACYSEEHTREHEKHRIAIHRERHILNEHRIETSIKSLIRRLSNLNESCSNLNESCSNLNESCSNLNKSCLNLSQNNITLTWWSNKEEHIRQHDKHRIKTHRERHESLIWCLSNLSESWSNLSQIIITLTW